MNQTIPKENYDVVIIGAGISGLTSAALFQKAGLSCCVLEMDPRPGGYMAGFERKKFRFDSAIHWLNDCGTNGLVTKIFRIIGDDFPKPTSQKRIRRFVSSNFDYLITNQPDQLKEQWIKEFPEDKKGIIRFFKDAQKIAKTFDKHINLSRSIKTMHWTELPIYGLKMLGFALPFIPHIRFSGDEGVKKGLAKYFKSEKLKSVFSSETDLLSCLIPIAWAYSNNFQNPPIGGGQAFPEWLIYTIKQMGGDLFFSSKVTRILVENKIATAVQLIRNNETIEIKGKYIVAACDAETLFEKMLPKNIVPEQTIKNLKEAELYSSAFTISIGLDCPSEELGFSEESIYISDVSLERELLGSGDPITSGIHVLSPSVRDNTLAPQGKGTLTIFIPAWIESFDYWKCKKDENGNFIRGDEYKKLKQEIADIVIDRVQDKLTPNLRQHIEVIDIATPITHFRYTGNKNGSMMGQRPGKKNMNKKVASYHTPVKNVFLSGHWADYGGGVPIAIKSAINTSLMILKQENKSVFKLLASYMDGKIDIKNLKASNQLKSYDNSWTQDLTVARKDED